MNAIISLINQQLYAPNQKLNTVISIKCWESIKYTHYALFRWVVWNKPRLFILKIPDGKWVFHSKFKTLQTFEWSQINCHFFDYVTTQNNISCVFDYILDKVFWTKKVNFVLEIAQQRCSDSKMIQLWRNMRAIESL